MASHALDELLELLMSEREDVRNQAYLAVAQLTGTTDGALLVGKCRSIMSMVVASVTTTPIDDKSTLLPTTLTTLTNVTATAAGANFIVTHLNLLLKQLLKLITDCSSCYADRASGLLVNLTRDDNCCRPVLTQITKDDEAFYTLMVAACTTSHNTAGNNLHLLMSAIENISQIEEGRKLLLDREQFLLQRLLPFVSYKESTSRRRAAVATLHNCCFSKGDHMWLLSEAVDIGSFLCQPLCGPDNFTDDETSKLSDMLIYMPEDKKIEDNIDIRLLLLQALTQLCTTRSGRVELRRQEVYFVLRELHKWEQQHSCLLILEDLVNILIRTEDEMGVDDISTLEVTEDMQKKFVDFDKETIKDPEPDEKKE